MVSEPHMKYIFPRFKWRQIKIPSVYTGKILRRLIYMHLIHLTLAVYEFGANEVSFKIFMCFLMGY